MRPMLAKPAENPAVTYLNNPSYVIEQKLDGERLLIEVNDQETLGFNRNGLPTEVPTSIAANFDKRAFSGKWVFDGEMLGDQYFVFDCVQAKTEIEPETQHQHRFGFLRQLMDVWNPVNIHLVPYADNRNIDKKAFFKTCEKNAEGVVFKLNIGHYRPGKRTMENLKWKFTDTVDVIVTGLNADGHAQSINIGLWHGDTYKQYVSAGGCKIPEEAVGKLSVGEVIEVKYLYATPDHKLVQPTWHKRRLDKNAAECNTDQLKYTSKAPVT